MGKFLRRSTPSMPELILARAHARKGEVPQAWYLVYRAQARFSSAKAALVVCRLRVSQGST